MNINEDNIDCNIYISSTIRISPLEDQNFLPGEIGKFPPVGNHCTKMMFSKDYYQPINAKLWCIKLCAVFLEHPVDANTDHNKPWYSKKLRGWLVTNLLRVTNLQALEIPSFSRRFAALLSVLLILLAFVGFC